MLEKINNLGVFFEDCYREISVREYSRKINISPPTASKLLKKFVDEGLLDMREERGFLLFRVNRDSIIMRDLSRIYWRIKLNKLTNYIKSFNPKSIVLFGSLSKLEAKKDSDIDLAVFGIEKEKINIEKFEKKYKRNIQIFLYKSLSSVNEELRLNILNGYILRGYLS